MKKQELGGRRHFLLSMARGLGLSAMGALVWSAYIDEIKASPLVLRPPGALDEDEFIKSCIKCGLCVEACPYDTLFLAAPGDNKPIGTPFFTPRDVPCYMCEDIPCVPVCPTGSLVEDYVKTDGEFDIKKIDIGKAVVDTSSCIAYWGIQCDACYRACPLLDEAIKLEYSSNERTGKHAFLKPIVDMEVCTGCGLCERACITDKPAIYVLPNEIALGKAGSHYIKGWDKDDEKRLKGAKNEVKTTDLSSKSVLDSLNDDGDLY